MTPNETDADLKIYQEVPGDWINDQMRRSRDEFKIFAEARSEYNLKKARYNGSLRLQYTNFFTDLFDQRPGQLFSFGELNAIFPQAEKIGASEYTRPDFPFAIYNPPEYYGPKLDNIGYDQIVCGYGKPMATMYELESGGGLAGNPGKNGKNYKNFGIMGLIQMTEEHKVAEGNYNKAVTASNTKLEESVAASKLVTDLEAEREELVDPVQ